MKNFSKLLFTTLLCSIILVNMAWAQSPVALQGAYERTIEKEGEQVTQLLMISDGFFSWSEYKTENGAFLMTKGGKITLDKGQLKAKYEFHTAHKDKVGQTEMWQAIKKKKKFSLDSGDGALNSWKTLEANAEKSPLKGAWLISGRERNGNMGSIDTDRPRKTMKLLTNTRFQWIAYNTETGEFFGTGGGAYTAKDGRYTENIGFFSRDDSRVGASLGFDFDVQEGDWHHKGLSSKGDPIYEIWSRRN